MGIKLYDDKGRLTGEASYYVDGFLRRKPTFDADGNRTEERQYGPDGVLRQRLVYTYNAQGNKTSFTKYRVTGSTELETEKHAYAYDEEGNLTEDATYHLDGSLTVRRIFEYDADKRLTKESRYRDGFIGGTIYSHDDNGNVSEYAYLDKNAEVHWRETYQYDDNNNLLEWAEHDGDQIHSKEVHKYDLRGNKIEQFRNVKGKFESRSVWKYDDHDNCVDYTRHGADGSIKSKMSYTYEYDSKGNWVRMSLKRTLSAQPSKPVPQHPKPYRVYYQTIAYFDDPTEHQAEKLRAELMEIISNPPTKKPAEAKPKLRVEVKLYADSTHSEELRFFDTSGLTLPRSVHYAVRCTSNGTTAVSALSGGLYDPSGSLVQDLSGESMDSSGRYNGSYKFQENDPPGVWLLKVGCEKSDHLGGSDVKYLHLYCGSGVSSYKMDFDKTSFDEESVLENKHLIAVFGNAKVSNKVLIYMYQKDTNASYTFGKTNIGRFDYMYNRFDGFGEMTSNQSVDRFYSANLSEESESLSSASLSLGIELVYPINELATGTVFNSSASDNVSIWENTSGGYSKVWEYTDADLDNAQSHAIGDINNDGVNEVVFFTKNKIMIFEYQSGGYLSVWNFSVQPDCIRIMGTIGDSDNDGENEVIAHGGGCSGAPFYIIDHNGTDYYLHYTDKMGGNTITGDNAIGDFDHDGENEIVVIYEHPDQGIQIYEFDGTNYTNTVNMITYVGNGIDDLSAGDIDGDGFPEIVVCGNGKNWQVINYTNGAYGTMYLSPEQPYYVQTCEIGDLNNDGMGEVVVGLDQKLTVWEYQDGSFVNTWNSSLAFALGMGTAEIADADSDGLNELVLAEPSYEGGYDMSVWGSKTGGPPFQKIWTKVSYLIDESPMYIAVGDTDNDGYETNFTIDITLSSEDADWLEYRVHSMKVDPNISSVFSILSGCLGPEIADDRYHLENGSDDLIANLKPNTWNDFASNYCMIYDNSAMRDAVNKTVLAWVRFKESENVKFEDVGLWNDANGKASSRIRYNIKDATSGDWFSYLLVFSTGDKRTIDARMQAIRTGRLPETTFMTPPSR